MNDIRHDLLTAIEMYWPDDGWIPAAELAKVCGFHDGVLSAEYQAALHDLRRARLVSMRWDRDTQAWQYHIREPQTQPERIRSHIQHFGG
jgi:hypothetical protein